MQEDYRIDHLEEDVTELKKDVKNILTNHLPHICKDLGVVKAQLVIFGGLILTALSVIIAKVFS